MKKTKTYIILTLCIGLIFGCKNNSSKKAEEKICIKIKTPTLAMTSVTNENIHQSADFLAVAAQKFNETEMGKNIDIVIEVFDYIDEHKVVVESYNTDDAVDVLYEGYFNMEAYISGGKVVPLDDIITGKIYADIPESSWEQSRKNGKTYMLPFLSLQNILVFNKKLFLDCGLQKYILEEPIIQNWTIEEWEEVLDTLAAKLPQSSFPIMMYALNNQGDTHIMSFIRAFGSKIFNEQGDFDFETPEAIKALKWIQDGVKRGWYAPHCENLEIVDNQTLFNAGKMGIYLFNNQSFGMYENPIRDFGFVNFPNNVATSFVTGFEVFDNNNEEKLKAAKSFVKFIYETPELLELSAGGGIPESKSVVQKHRDALPMLEEFSNNEKNVVDFINADPNWQGRPDSVRSVFYKHIHELLAGRITPEQCAAGLNKDCNAAIHVEVKYHE